MEPELYRPSETPSMMQEQGASLEATQQAILEMRIASPPRLPLRYTPASAVELAGWLDEQGRCGEAEQLLIQALNTREKALAQANRDMLTTMTALASVLRHEKKFEDSEVVLRQTLELREKWLGKRHRETVVNMVDLIELLHDRGMSDKAERITRLMLDDKSETMWSRA